MRLNKIQITTPEHVSLRMKVAGLGSRAAAHIVDWIILGIIYLALLFLLAKTADTNFIFADYISSYITAAIIILLFLTWWSYFVLFEFFASGRTPGKMLSGIRVIQDNGQSLTFLSSTIRNLFRIIDFLPLFYLLGILLIFFHPKHKRIGDLTAGTLVVYQRKFRSKANMTLEKEIAKKANRTIEVDEWSLKKYGAREWDLLKTYIRRHSNLVTKERNEMTIQVADILLPLIGLETEGRPTEEIEADLFALYIKLREEWDYYQ